MNDISVLLNRTGLGADIPLAGSLLQLLLSLILNLGLALLYNSLNKKRKKSHEMMHSMVYIGLIMTGAMLLIASNPIVAVGLFGAVSIVPLPNGGTESHRHVLYLPLCRCGD